MFYHWQEFQTEPERYYAALQECVRAGADGYASWDGAAMGLLADTPLRDLSRLPQPPGPSTGRLLRKHNIVRWCGYRWKGYPPIEGW